MRLIRSYERAKVADILRRQRPRKICLVFWHGLGDLVMFMTSFYKMKKLFPNVQIDIALQDGTGQEALVRDVILIRNPNQPIEGYDYTFQIHYPMSEHMKGRWTKNEWCCMEELGIDPISSYPTFKKLRERDDRKLVAVNFQATALPDDCNPTEEVAQRIWDEIKDAGFVPVEAFFRHAWYNPVNEKFSFIPERSTVREIKPTVTKLIRLLQACEANISVSTANFHMGMATMPERTMYLQKKFLLSSYTKNNIASMVINKYEGGGIKSWLETLV